MIEPGRGNLLEADADALVNTVNTVGVMGKGLALQFRQAFPENYEAYRRACAREDVRIGEMFTFATGRLTSPRWIVNFPTKRHWRSDSRLEDIDAGLADLVRVVRDRDIRSIAVPPLGCGNGGLDWDDVRPLIEKHLGPLDEVKTILFAPSAGPAPETMPVATKRPTMTANRAALLQTMRRYRMADDYRQTAIEVQKIAYFLQAAGQPLRLDWRPHVYGPYAEKLNHVLRDMEAHFIRGVGDRAVGASIRVMPEAEPLIERTLAEDRSAHERVEDVAALIDRFETPYGMELLGTVHWVATRRPEADRSPDAALAGVRDWSPRKAAWPERHVGIAWERLRDLGWFERRVVA